MGLRGIDMQRPPRTATADFHRRLTSISRSATRSPFSQLGDAQSLRRCVTDSPPDSCQPIASLTEEIKLA